MSMKVTGIINRGFTQFNRLKYAKVTEDISVIDKHSTTSFRQLTTVEIFLIIIFF